MHFERCARGRDSEKILSARPLRSIISEENRFEVEVWALRLDREFRDAVILANRLDIGVPILLCAKHHFRVIGGIHDANRLFVHRSLLLGHNRIDTTSSCKARAISLRLTS